MEKKKKKKIRTFEDLEVYKMARAFSRKISKLIKILPEAEKYNLKHQMKRAKLSLTKILRKDMDDIIIRKIFSFADNHVAQFMS